jgi:hypothetical protein
VYDLKGKLLQDVSDEWQPAQHPRTAAGSYGGTGGEFAAEGAKPIATHGRIEGNFTREVQRAYDSAPQKMRDMLKDTPVHVFESIEALRQQAPKVLGVPQDVGNIPLGTTGVFFEPNPRSSLRQEGFRGRAWCVPGRRYVHVRSSAANRTVHTRIHTTPPT